HRRWSSGWRSGRRGSRDLLQIGDRGSAWPESSPSDRMKFLAQEPFIQGNMNDGPVRLSVTVFDALRAGELVTEPFVKTAGDGVGFLRRDLGEGISALRQEALSREDEARADTEALEYGKDAERPEDSGGFGGFGREINPDLADGPAIKVGDDHHGLAALLGCESLADDLAMHGEHPEPLEAGKIFAPAGTELDCRLYRELL